MCRFSLIAKDGETINLKLKNGADHVFSVAGPFLIIETDERVIGVNSDSVRMFTFDKGDGNEGYYR